MQLAAAAAANLLHQTGYKTGRKTENSNSAFILSHISTVILIIMGIPSPTHSFTLGFNPYFSANPPYRSLSFFFFRIHYMDFPDCLLLLLSISVSLLFSFFLFLHFLVVGSVR